MCVCVCDRSTTVNMARVYADVNQNMPRAYWDYDSVNISTSRLPTELDLRGGWRFRATYLPHANMRAR